MHALSAREASLNSTNSVNVQRKREAYGDEWYTYNWVELAIGDFTMNCIVGEFRFGLLFRTLPSRDREL